MTFPVGNSHFCTKARKGRLLQPPCIMCVQYIGGCSVHRGVFSTSGDTMSTSGDTMSTLGGYHEYIGGISWCMWGDIMSTSGDIQYIEGTMSTSGRYHEYIGGISWCMWGSKLVKTFQFLLKTPMYWTSAHVLISPWCTHGISPTYWTSPDVLMISPRCTHGVPPMYSWYPPMHSWYDTPPPPPPMYSWYRPDVLNIPRCTEHTLYRVNREQEKLTPHTWKDKTSQTGFLYWFGMAYCK